MTGITTARVSHNLQPSSTSPYPPTTEGICKWAKQELDCDPPIFYDLWDGCPRLEFLEEQHNQSQRMKAIWQASNIFRSAAPELNTKAFWQACPMTNVEFEQMLSVYYQEEKRRYGAFGVGAHHRVPVAYMTAEQQLSYMRLLAKNDHFGVPQYSRTLEGICNWAKRKLDDDPPIYYDSWDGYPRLEFLEEQHNHRQWEKAIWQASNIFRSKEPELNMKAFWQACPMTNEEFALALSIYYEEEEKRHGAFGVGYDDLVPITHMTREQQLAYIRLLAKNNPKVLAEHFRSWTCTKEQVEEALTLLAENSPANLLLIDKFRQDKWSDQQSHPELVEFLQNREASIFYKKIFEDPKTLRFLRNHIKRLKIEFTVEQREYLFSQAAVKDPLFFITYKEILQPSEGLESTVLEYIFANGCSGAVDLYLLMKNEKEFEDQERCIELLIRTLPEDVLLRASRFIDLRQLAKAFKASVLKRPRACITFNEIFTRSLTPAQRKEIVDIVYKMEPEVLLDLDLDHIPEKEKNEYIEDYRDFVTFRRCCIFVSDLFSWIGDKCRITPVTTPSRSAIELKISGINGPLGAIEPVHALMPTGSTDSTIPDAKEGLEAISPKETGIGVITESVHPSIVGPTEVIGSEGSCITDHVATAIAKDLGIGRARDSDDISMIRQSETSDPTVSKEPIVSTIPDAKDFPEAISPKDPNIGEVTSSKDLGAMRPAEPVSLGITNEAVTVDPKTSVAEGPSGLGLFGSIGRKFWAWMSGIFHSIFSWAFLKRREEG